MRAISLGMTIFFFSSHSGNSLGYWQRNSTEVLLSNSSILLCMGFWGEGHTWPFINTPFPDYQTAERTWINMLEVQLEHFT
jgi:hypothetical protein